MGRAGRGGGGGSRGGGFGGSRGFGSHSGSTHRSSFSSSSFRSSSHRSSNYRSSSHSSWGGSYHRHYNSGPRFYYFGGTRYSNSTTGGGYTNIDPAAVARSIIKTMMWFIIIITIISVVFGTGAYSSNSITPSTVNREKFDGESYYDPNNWYTDELGWIKSSSTLESGMRHFYEKTGVQPYLYITGDPILADSKMQQYANALYDSLFDDEAHLLVVFNEHNDNYKSCYVVGVEAKTVIDDEAGEILLDYIDHYYYSNYDEDEFFARSFREAADRIMRVTPKYGWIAFIFILVIVLAVILFTWWKKKKQHKLDEMKHAQDILNSDLNEFGGSAAYAGSSFDSSEAEELKKKYDN